VFTITAVAQMPKFSRVKPTFYSSDASFVLKRIFTIACHKIYFLHKNKIFRQKSFKQN